MLTSLIAIKTAIAHQGNDLAVKVLTNKKQVWWKFGASVLMYIVGRCGVPPALSMVKDRDSRFQSKPASWLVLWGKLCVQLRDPVSINKIESNEERLLKLTLLPQWTHVHPYTQTAMYTYSTHTHKEREDKMDLFISYISVCFLVIGLWAKSPQQSCGEVVVMWNREEIATLQP